MKQGYTTHTYPASRIATFDVGRVGLYRHHVIGLVEVDVTVARKKIRALRNKGVPVSFTAWMIKCIGDILNENPLAHGVRRGKRKIVTFDGVDISIIVEREIGSQSVPLPFIIREANAKSIQDIHREIRAVKEQFLKNEGDYVLGTSRSRFMMSVYYALPGFLRRLFWKMVLSSPRLVRSAMGSVVVTSVGMIGKVNGWIIPRTINPLCLATSSINEKPGVVNGRILIREYLPVTVLIDHDVIDGAPAVRIMSGLVRAIETGYLL